MTIAYVGGIAARSERYMRDHWAFAKGLSTAAALAESRRREEQDHIALQQAAGLPLLSPALVAWEDLGRLLCQEGSGVQVGRLTRVFETNTFYRQPVVTGPFGAIDAAQAFAAFAVAPGSPWVLSLPSPWDFACRADDQTGGTRGDLARATGDALRPLVQAAIRQGATLVRFQEPSLGSRRAPAPDVEAIAASLRRAAGPHATVCTLHLGQGDPFLHPAALEANPLGGLSVAEPKGNLPRLSLPNGTKLSVAALHGEDSLIESPLRLAQDARGVADRLGLGLWGLTNGWDLDHVPHAIAGRKIAALGQATSLLEEVLA